MVRLSAEKMRLMSVARASGACSAGLRELRCRLEAPDRLHDILVAARDAAATELGDCGWAFDIRTLAHGVLLMPRFDPVRVLKCLGVVYNSAMIRKLEASAINVSELLRVVDERHEKVVRARKQRARRAKAAKKGRR
jgi:hypothetical protein